jgi:hypothetical protein
MGSDPNSNHQDAAPRVRDVDGKLTMTFTRNAAATDLILSVWAADSPTGPWLELACSTAGQLFAVSAAGASVNETATGTTITVQIGDIYALGDPNSPARLLRLRVDH